MRPRPLALALLLTLAPAIVRADAPEVVTKPVERVNVGDMAPLDATASKGDVFEWGRENGRTFQATDKFAAVIFDAPGTYTVGFRAYGVVDGKVAKAAGSFTIEVIERPAPVPPPAPIDPNPPGPGPQPNPPPGPTPTPVVGRLYVSLVVDTNAMTIGLAKIRKGNEIRAQQAPLQFGYYTHSTSDPDIMANNLQPSIAQAGGAPCLIIQGPVNPATGKAEVLLREKAPVDEAGVLERVKFVRAGGTNR